MVMNQKALDLEEPIAVKHIENCFLYLHLPNTSLEIHCCKGEQNLTTALNLSSQPYT